MDFSHLFFVKKLCFGFVCACARARLTTWPNIWRTICYIFCQDFNVTVLVGRAKLLTLFTAILTLFTLRDFLLLFCRTFVIMHILYIIHSMYIVCYKTVIKHVKSLFLNCRKKCIFLGLLNMFYNYQRITKSILEYWNSSHHL